MIARILRILAWSLVLLIVGTLGYQYAAAYRPESERAALLSQGRALYATLCHDCHGDRMEGRTLPSTGEVVQPLDKRGFRFFFYLMPAGMEGFVADRIGNAKAGMGSLRPEVNGRVQTSMPEFGSTLAPRERLALAVLIHAVNVGEARLP